MKITLTQERLAKALNYTSRAVSNKPNIPVLSNVLLEVAKDDLKLSATNLDMGIHMWIGGQAEDTGKLTVSGKFLTDFVNANSSGKVVLEHSGEVMKVETPNSKADFQTISAEEFPVLPSVQGDPFFTISAKELIRALDRTIFACATDIATSQIQFSGVLFSLKAGENKLTMVGLDGYRLSELKLELEEAVDSDVELIVPARPLQEMVKIASSEGAETVGVHLSESKSQIIFSFGEVEFSVRLLEGPYPNYQQIIPQKSAFSFELDKSEFEQALKIVNTFARNIQGYRVEWDLDVETDQLTLRSQVPDLGVNETVIKVKKLTANNDLKNAFNLMYLMDLVNHISGEVISFATNSPLEPAVFTSKEDKGFMHLVMPLQRD